MCACLCLESVWGKLWDVWGYREPRSKLPANTNRQHALVYTEHHLYPHISILQAGANSKLGITYNYSVYIVKINNDPACDSLPSLDHAQQCWKAFCFQSFTFKQNMLHAPLIMLFFNLLHMLYAHCNKLLVLLASLPTWSIQDSALQEMVAFYCFFGLYKNARRFSLLAIFNCGTVFTSIIEGPKEFCKSIFMCFVCLRKYSNCMLCCCVIYW